MRQLHISEKQPVSGTYRIVSLLLALLVSLCLACGMTITAGATDSNSDSTGASYELYIDDQADLLTDEEEQALRGSVMSEVLEYGNMMFTTVTLEDGADYETWAENSYYETFGNEPGVNFQIDMGNRKLTLSASTGMEDLIGSERDSIVDNIYVYASDGDYAGCAEECFREIYDVLHGYRISHKMKYINNAILALIFGLLLNFIVVFVGFRPNAAVKSRKKGIRTSAEIRNVSVVTGALTKTYSPAESSSGGSSGGGGGGFSGGGGGGGFSGGSSSHGF